MKTTDIIQKYTNGEISQDDAIDQMTEAFQIGEVTREDLNAGLKELVAGYSFKELTDEEREAKKQREDEEGFFEPEDKGLERKFQPTLELPDMKRYPDRANLTVIQRTKKGEFYVDYDENGYAVKSYRK